MCDGERVSQDRRSRMFGLHESLRPRIPARVPPKNHPKLSVGNKNVTLL